MKKSTYINEFKEWKKGFQFVTSIKVRFTETDMFGHVNNTTVFTYFEEARLEFFKKIGIMKYWLDQNSRLIPVVADLQCDYLAQSFFDEVLHVYMKVNKVGRTSVDLHYLIEKEDGTIVNTGRGAIVQISKVTGKPEVWEETWRKQLQEHLIAEKVF